MSNRNSELAKIHIAKKDLCLDDAAYRQLLWTVARVKSASDLDAHGRGAVLEHFKARGWQAKAAKRAGKVPHTLNRKAQLAKIEAQLADMGLSWAYADTIAQHIAKIDRVAWLKKTHHFKGVIAALAVEQKKRGQLANVNRMLDALGWTHADIDALLRPGRRGRWQRHVELLGQIEAYLADRCEKAGIDLMALVSEPEATD